ncbi:MAG: hypothetical protein AVDCRST_MAG90-98, partial [uncultured Microvirga sp.]
VCLAMPAAQATGEGYHVFCGHRCIRQRLHRGARNGGAPDGAGRRCPAHLDDDHRRAPAGL